MADTLRWPRSITRVATPERVATVLFLAISVTYFVQATLLAARAPFWMDEVLTLWTARLPSVGAIWSALERGAEFTPPLYDWLIHALLRAGVTDALDLRLPSIVAIYVAALATGTIARRHAGTPPAAAAAGVVLSSGLFGYAVQLRPYALVTAAFAGALMLYDRPGRASDRRRAAIAGLLALAIGLHFYALLLAGLLSGLEFIRARVEHRAVDRRMLVAIALAASTVLLYLPILIAAHAYSNGDVGAPDYYARPVLLALVRTYAMLLGGLIVPLVVLLAANGRERREVAALRVAALVIAAAPLAIFGFAVLISHSYADRYALAGGIGIALLFAALTRQLGPRAGVASVIVLAAMLASAIWRPTGEIDKADRRDALAVALAAPDALPIVTGSGLRFFEMRENLSLGDRLVFLDTPAIASSDPTNQHQVRRWKAIDPSLPVADAQAFLCATPAFYLFAQSPDGGADDLPDWLAGRADFTLSPAGRASLTLVRPHSCARHPWDRP